MSGKPAIAPCGHPGEHVVGNYVRCLQRCHRKAAPEPPPDVDAAFAEFDDEEATGEYFIMPPACRGCGSGDVSSHPFVMHCRDCGAVW